MSKKTLISNTITVAVLLGIIFLITEAMYKAPTQTPKENYGYIDYFKKEGRAIYCRTQKGNFICRKKDGTNIQVVEYWELED